MNSNPYDNFTAMPSAVIMPIPSTDPSTYNASAVTMPRAQPAQAPHAAQYPPSPSAYNISPTQNGFLAPPPMGPYPQTTSTTCIGAPQGMGAYGHSRPPSAMSFNSATVVPSNDGHHAQPRGPQNKPQATGRPDTHGCRCCIIM